MGLAYTWPSNIRFPFKRERGLKGEKLLILCALQNLPKDRFWSLLHFSSRFWKFRLKVVMIPYPTDLNSQHQKMSVPTGYIMKRWLCFNFIYLKMFPKCNLVKAFVKADKSPSFTHQWLENPHFSYKNLIFSAQSFSHHLAEWPI